MVQNVTDLDDAIFYYTLNWQCDPFEFPMRHACLVGIQVIPITSISYLYMDQVRSVAFIYFITSFLGRPIIGLVRLSV